MKGKTVNRSLPPPVQCREGFFIPLQYPRLALLVALAHLVLLASGPPSGSFRYTPFGASLLPAGPPHALGRLRAASVMNFVVDREKFQKNDVRAGRYHILREGVFGFGLCVVRAPFRGANSVFAGGTAMMKLADSRRVMALVCAGAAALAPQATGTLLFAQFQIQVVEIDLSPPDAADNDVITFRLTGIWSNGCVPQSPVVSVSPGTVRIDATNPGVVCTLSLTPWNLAGTIGKLSPGRYDVIVGFSGPSMSSPVELGRRSLTVADSSLLNEAILPIVVNGAIAEKLHFQTIFTVLNGSAGRWKRTLQVYSNAGAASGVFCSPLAPPPSNATFALSPNGQYLQFTSADLAFLNGWARLRWEGPASVLVSEELTLVAAAAARSQLVCDRPSTEKLSSAQIAAIKPAREFKMPMTINPNRKPSGAL